MPDITPWTDVTLYFDVPLNSDYVNTFYFSSALEQQAKFNSYRNVNFPFQSYQRKNRNTIRLDALYKDVYNANYLMFFNSHTLNGQVVNTVYEAKPFYAFIDDVIYINDHTVEIVYTIDVIQTYLFDWTFQDCFIERETTDSDNLYEHLIDEGLDLGEYENSFFRRIKSTAGVDFSEYRYIIAATMDENYLDTTDGAAITSQTGGIVSGCKMIIRNTADDVLDWLNRIPGGKESGVLGIYVVPTEIISFSYSGNNAVAIQSIPKHNTTVGNYVPINKKLLSSPYISFTIWSSDGNSVILDYRKASRNSNNIELGFRFAFTPPIQGFLYITDYDNSEGFIKIPLPQIPSCSWANDSYKAWVALNSGYVQTAISASVIDAGLTVASTAISMAANALNPLGMANSAISGAKSITGDITNIAALMQQRKNAKVAPDSLNGSAQSLSSTAARVFGFCYAQRHINEQYARAIDEFFTMFGYKVNRIGQPNLTSRRRFNYIKTTNCDINGEIPSADRIKICEIFNTGIRFWHDQSSEFGKYVNSSGELLANAIVSLGVIEDEQENS